jgi:hypothetical protein
LQDEAGVEILGRTELASSEIGGRLPQKKCGESCIGVLQKEGKRYKENTASTTDDIVIHTPVKKIFSENSP